MLLISVIVLLAARGTGIGGGAARADVRLNPLFSDNLVLQRDIKVPIWGTAAPDEKVTLSFAGQSAGAVAGKDGKWRVVLEPLAASKEPRELVVSAKNTVTIKNILVGEVWLACGQSNMDFPLYDAFGGNEAAQRADYPTIRFYKVAQRMASKPQDTAPGAWGGWVVCTPDKAPKFAAVPFFFVRELSAKLDVPFGVVDGSWWFTQPHAWSSRELLESDPDFKIAIEAYDKRVADSQKLLDDYLKRLQQWKDDVDRSDAAGVPVRPIVGPPDLPQVSQWMRPMGPYNAMIAPLMPFAIRGVIWHQGESNNGAPQYRKLFPALITDWRRRWGQGDFPFLFVQLTNMQQGKYDPANQPWVDMREAQAAALKLPNTGMAVPIDIGQFDDVHPRNKADVGHRLALLAEKIAYGKDVVASGPTYQSMKVDGDKIVLKFSGVGSGLVARDIAISEELKNRLREQGDADQLIHPGGGAGAGAGLNWFVIAGADQIFYPAQAKIDGDSVIVWSPEVSKPAAVRYAWADNPEGVNFYNKEGLPAAPFRTDAWPSPTTMPDKNFVSRGMERPLVWPRPATLPARATMPAKK
jgi:sialate O-acetylesterase